MFEEQQIGDPLDVVNMGITLIVQDVGVFPTFWTKALWLLVPVIPVSVPKIESSDRNIVHSM